MTTQTASGPVYAELTLYLCQPFSSESERTRAALGAWLGEVVREGYAAVELPHVTTAETADVAELSALFRANLNGEVVVISGLVEKAASHEWE